MKEISNEELFKYCAIPLLPMSVFSIFIVADNYSEFFELSIGSIFFIIVLLGGGIGVGFWGYLKWGFFNTPKKILKVSILMFLIVVALNSIRGCSLEKRKRINSSSIAK